MEKETKTSTDPQENEIDSNYLGDIFRKLVGGDEKNAERKQHNEQKEESDQTLDEKQDPANKK